MSFIDILRKLGIIRFGTKTGTYTSAKDMPAEFMMEGVYNADKELVTKKDVKDVVAAVTGNDSGQAGACPKCGAALKPEAKFCGNCGAPCGQPPVNKCAACGATIKPDAKFCVECGATVKNAVSAGKPARKKGCLLFVLIALGIIGILIILGIIGSSGDEKKKDVQGAASTAIPVSHMQGVESGTENKSSVMETKDQPVSVTPLKDWDPKSGKEAVDGPAGLKYDKYVNKKFGFATELPAHWESEVKDNTHLFCGAKGTEEYNTTVNFQFINKKPGSTLKSEADDMLSQWKTFAGFKLDKSDQGDLNGKQAIYMVVSYELPGGQTFRQMQAIIDREPYYYMIGYTAPKNLFMKYYFVMIHLISTFQYIEIQK